MKSKGLTYFVTLQMNLNLAQMKRATTFVRIF